jgi:hypothetical protein
MNDEKKSFTVTDRRHFTPEGRARETEPAFEPPPRAPVSESKPPEAVRPDAPAAAAAEPPENDEDLGLGAEDDELPPFPSDLLGLIGSLATQATVILAGNPGSGQPPTPPDLEVVRSIITLLDVLHQKTANNRDQQEERVLDAVRYELKMAYVARTRAGGA